MNHPKIAESGKIKYVPCMHSYKFVTNKIARRFEFQSVLGVGQETKLTKHKRNAKADESEECDSKFKHTLQDLKNKDFIVCKLGEELHNHGKQRTEKKSDLLQRLI